MELGDTSTRDFDTGDTAFAFLRSRALIARDAAGLERLAELRVSEDYLVAGRIRLGTLLDLVATFLDRSTCCTTSTASPPPPRPALYPPSPAPPPRPPARRRAAAIPLQPDRALPGQAKVQAVALDRLGRLLSSPRMGQSPRVRSVRISESPGERGDARPSICLRRRTGGRCRITPRGWLPDQQSAPPDPMKRRAWAFKTP